MSRWLLIATGILLVGAGGCSRDVRTIKERFETGLHEKGGGWGEVTWGECGQKSMQATVSYHGEAGIHSFRIFVSLSDARYYCIHVDAQDESSDNARMYAPFYDLELWKDGLVFHGGNRVEDEKLLSLGEQLQGVMYHAIH